MKKTLLPSLLFFLTSIAVFAQTSPLTYELKNGNFYNGTGFSPGTWYVAGGVFSKKAPAKIDTTIDLQNRFVIPPMGDAHCANVADNSAAANALKAYLEEGTFYLQILGNTQEGRTEVQKLLNKPTAPDVSFANGSITCTLGFPFMKYEAPVQGIRNPKKIEERADFIKQQRAMEGNGYWFVDNKDALKKTWPKIMAQKPGVISIYLLDVQNNGGKENKGLTADMAKAVVKKAHKSGLRVFAHIETADDLRLGLKIKVDGFANLPGHTWDGTGDLKKYELTDEDLKLLVKKKTALVTLLSHGQAASAANPSVKEFHLRTLKRLLDNGANVVVGAGDPQRGARAELNYWYMIGEIDYARVLKVLCENTPHAIFPDRKVGKIENGYEASFLVLSDNPLLNILKIRASEFKMKNGRLVK